MAAKRPDQHPDATAGVKYAHVVNVDDLTDGPSGTSQRIIVGGESPPRPEAIWVLGWSQETPVGMYPTVFGSEYGAAKPVSPEYEGNLNYPQSMFIFEITELGDYEIEMSGNCQVVGENVLAAYMNFCIYVHGGTALSGSYDTTRVFYDGREHNVASFNCRGAMRITNLRDAGVRLSAMSSVQLKGILRNVLIRVTKIN